LKILCRHGPVELVPQKLKQLGETRDAAQSFASVTLRGGRHPSCNSSQQTRRGLGAPIGTSSCFRYVFLTRLSTQSRMSTSVGRSLRHDRGTSGDERIESAI